MAGNGLQQGRSQGMDGYTGNLTEFNIDPADTNPMFRGDPVAIAAGFVEDASGATPGAVTGPITGVFMGWQDKGPNQAVLGSGMSPFSPQWTGAAGAVNPVAAVALPPHSFFYIRGDDTVTFTQADVGTRRDFIYALGDARTAQSRVTLGAVSVAGAMIIQRLAPLPGNEWSDAEPIIEVAIVAQAMTAADVA